MKKGRLIREISKMYQWLLPCLYLVLCLTVHSQEPEQEPRFVTPVYETDVCELDVCEVDLWTVILFLMDKAIDHAELTRAIDHADWETVLEIGRKHLPDEEIEVLQDYLERHLKFQKVKLSGFLECRASWNQKHTGLEDEKAYVITSYKEKVKEGDVIIFDVMHEHADVVSAIKFIMRNKDKISAIIVGWESGRMKNFSRRVPTTDDEIMENYRKFFAFCKPVAPQIPVGIVVCKSQSWKAWIDTCGFEYDFLAIWNIHRLKVNLEEYKKFFPGEQLFIAGMNAMGRNPEYGGAQYQEYINKLKESEQFVGSIWIKSKRY